MSKRDKTSQKLLDSLRKSKADSEVSNSPNAEPASAPAPVLNAVKPPAQQVPAAPSQPPRPAPKAKPSSAQPPAEEPRRILSSRRVWPD